MRNQIRIIAGKYRGRKLVFPNSPDLRPTPDRVRETLFNWLAPFIVGARCLDAFAGSGVLGLEALSRGAAWTTFLEKNAEGAKHIQQNAALFHETHLQILTVDTLSWLEKNNTDTNLPFDMVFLDPPYQSHLLLSCFSLLENHHWLAPNALIYFESVEPISESSLPASWQLLHNKKAGQVYYALAKKLRQ